MGFLEQARSANESFAGTEVVVTGTGVPSIDPARAGAGVLVRHGDITLHIDAGRGTAARVVEFGVDVGDVDAIFLTHYHSDHVSGLQDFILGRWLEDDLDLAEPLTVVASIGPTTRFCERLVALWDDDLAVRAEHNGRPSDLRLDVVGFETPERMVEVWSRGEVRVLAGPVRHEPVVGAVGYRIETPDGVVAITGDTVVCPEVADLASGADVVVYEAMRTPLIKAFPAELHFIADYHADTVEIGEQMADLEVSNVMLTHLLPPPVTQAEKDGFLEDVRAGGFTGNVIVCDDLDRVVIVERPDDKEG